MLRKILIILPSTLLLTILVILLNLPLAPATYAFTRPKPTLNLNRSQGPLGVTLTLKGENFSPGQATLSYIDSQNTPGTFTDPSDTSVQVQPDGTFITTNVILPSSGPVGTWKVVVTQNTGKPESIPYLVLAAPGQQTAGVPSLTVNPASGVSGNAITFTGSNWLPQGTPVKLTLLVDTISFPLLDTPPVSDRNGMVTGTFHLPANLNASQVTVNATDVDTEALRAQTQILITNVTPTPSPSPTTIPTPTTVPTPVSTPSPVPPAPGRGDNFVGPLSSLDAALWGPALLIVAGILAVGAVMLILFLIPWEERRQNLPHGRQY